MFFLLLIPPVLSMVWALFNEYRRGNTLRSVTLTLITLVVLIRFVTLAMDSSGMTMSPLTRSLELLGGLYIVPVMYMYLCDQCGTRWNNREAVIMLLLPLLVLFGTNVIELGDMAEGTHHADAMANAINIYKDGQRLLYIRLAPTVVVTQCVIVAACMVRLYYRIRQYGLKLSRPMVSYYVWMFFMLFTISVTWLLRYTHYSGYSFNLMHAAAFCVLISWGYLTIPSAFNVAPIVTVDEEKPAQLDNFVEQNRHLADHLHQLMEEDRVYLRQGIHIDDVAAMMGTNRTYVTRLMRTEFGQTFTDYVNNARVIYSKKLLLTSSMSLEDIAQASGFPSASAYCRVFKRLTETSPVAWKSEQGE